MKLFFSYGRDASAPFVERIYKALNANGHECWMDKHDIPPDEDWRRRITTGLYDTDRTLAFLSDHALRDGSVCLDELWLASQVNGGPVTPIMLETLTEPFPTRIDRRNAIDMTDWPTRGTDPAWLAQKTATLLAVLNDKDALNQATELRTLRHWLGPTTHEYEMPALLEGFVGRRWLLDHVEAWRKGEKRILCITGGPGAGKSAFAAWLADTQRATVVALNLCRAGSDLRTDPASVVCTLAYLAATRLPDYRLRLLHAKAVRDPAGDWVRRANGSDLFDALLNDALVTPNGRGADRLVFIIDSLDESMKDGRSPLLDVLIEKAKHLPPWVALILTTRDEPRLTTKLVDIDRHHIEDDAGNDEDIAVYAKAWRGNRGQTADGLDREVARIVKAAQGNMLALTLLRKAVGEGKIAIDDPLPLPQGLDGILLRWMERQFQDLGFYGTAIRPPLQMLAAAGQPVPIPVLKAVMHWSDLDRLKAVERMGSLFPVRADSLTAWHPALLEFLRRDAATSDFMLDPAEGARALLAHLWTPATLAAPDDFAAAVLPRLVSILGAPTLAPRVNHDALAAIWAGATTLQRPEAWTMALEWWAMLSNLSAASPPASPGWPGRCAAMIGDIHVTRGDLQKALTSFTTYRTSSERLAAADAGNPQWQRDLSISHEKIGDVLVARGDLASALAAFRAGMTIRERLAAAHPDNAEWQRDLSISHNRIGDVLVARGDLAGALAAFRADMTIAERLAAADAGNAQWQRDLSVSHGKIGGVLMAQGDLAGALAAFHAGMTIAERLAAADMGNAQWQRDLSISHNKIGGVLVARGDLAGALAAFRADMTISERLAAADAGNAQWQRDLSISHSKIGDVLVARGDLAGALAAFRKGMTIAERLAAADTGNAIWQRDLFVSLYKLANLHLKAGQDACPTAQRLDAQARLLADRFPQDRQRDVYLEAAATLLAAACPIRTP